MSPFPKFVELLGCWLRLPVFAYGVTPNEAIRFGSKNLCFVLIRQVIGIQQRINPGPMFAEWVVIARALDDDDTYLDRSCISQSPAEFSQLAGGGGGAA